MFILAFLLSLFVTAQVPPMPVYPSYEPEVTALLALFNQDKLAPSYLRTKFNELTNSKRKEIAEYEKKHRESLMREQKETKRQFDDAEKEALKQWRRENAKGNFPEYQKNRSEKRKAFTDLQAASRRRFEEDIRAKRAVFNEFMKIRQEEFQKKFTEYSEAQKQKPKAVAEPNPALQEFKEIPKGPGIPLSPGKE